MALALAGVALILTTLCFRLGSIPLISDEGRNAEIAREMAESGAWLVPTYNGVDFLDKPAFYFKTVALSLQMLGRNETAARIPSALFGIALVAMVFAFCRRMYGTRVAWLAAVVVATTPLYFANARIVIFDMALTFFMCGSIFAGFLAEETDGRARRNWYLLGALSAGLATLVKGPVGFILPVIVLLSGHRANGCTGFLKRLFAPLNFCVFFAVTLPWFVGLCLARPDFLHYGLYEETFGRFVSSRQFHRSQPIYFYPYIIAATFFPWSVLLPGAIYLAWKTRPNWQRTDRLCLCWCIGALIFFSISRSKQPNYVLNVTVACGILLARLIDSAARNPAGQLHRLVMRTALTMAIVCGVAALGALGLELTSAGLPSWIRVRPEQAAQVLDRTSQWAVVFGLLSALGAVVWVRKNVAIGFASVALFWPVLIATQVGFAANLLADRSAKPIAAALHDLPPNTEVVCLQCYPRELAFYLDQTLTVITEDGAELSSNYAISLLARSPSWPTNMVRLGGFDDWLANRRQPLCLIGKAGDARLRQIAAASGASVTPLSRKYSSVRLSAKPGP